MYYHVWFVTKYRKTILEGEIEKRAKDAFLEVARNKNYNILEMETNGDHAHLLLEARDREELANMLRILKSVSAKKILEGTPHLRVGNARIHEGYHTRKCAEVRKKVRIGFWARRYGWREVDHCDVENIREYVRNQKEILH